MKPVETVQARGLLRSKKYYVKATNGACASCKEGKTGCCHAGLYFERSDFRLSLASVKRAKSLLETGVFFSPNWNGIRIRGRTIVIHRKSYSYERDVCVFWTDKGCRLAHDVRPRICRNHVCGEFYDARQSFNQEDWNRVVREMTLTEIDTLTKVFSADIPEFLTEQEYNSLDWDSILKTLQGFA